MKLEKREIENLKELVRSFNNLKVDMTFADALKLVRLLEWLQKEISIAETPLEIKPLESPITKPEKKNVAKSK